MDWIKKNPAQLALAVVALGGIAASFMLWQNTNGFAQTFAEGQVQPSPKKGIPDLDTKFLDEATKAIGTPVAWKYELKNQGSLFVGRTYIKAGDGIKRPEGSYFQPPVSNDWFEKYKLNYLSSTTLEEDPDRDGFSTLLEWNGMDGKSHLSPTSPGQPVMGDDGKPLPDDSTSPIDPASHPPYYTRLTLAPLPNGQVGIVSIPFRLKFMVADVNPRNPKDVTIQINTVDLRGKTNYVQLGEIIPGTKYKTESFEKKEQPLPDGTTKDTSELIIVNTVTGKKLPLPIGVVVDSPESYMVLRYLWVAPGGQPTPDMNLRKDETFTLPPEKDKTYKVVDIKPAPKDNSAPGEVIIQLPTGGTLVLKTNSPLTR